MLQLYNFCWFLQAKSGKNKKKVFEMPAHRLIQHLVNPAYLIV